MTTAGPTKNIFILPGITGPTGLFEIVNILPTGPTNGAGATGDIPHRLKTFNQLTGPTGASGPTGTFKTVCYAGATGIVGKRTIIVPGYAGGGGAPASTWNPADKTANVTLSATNHLATVPVTGANAGVRGTLSHASGKWYFEMNNYIDGQFNNRLGFATSGHDLTQYNSTLAFGIANPGGFLDGGSPALGEPQGHAIGFAIDITAGRWWARLDAGTWIGSGAADPVAGTGGVNYTATVAAGVALFPYAQLFSNAGNIAQVQLNCGDSAFTAAAPTGFTKWG